MKFTFSISLLIIILVFHSCKGEVADPKIECTDNSKYSSDIKPIVNNRCSMSGCHNSGSKNGDFTTYAGLKSKAENGTLRERIVIKKDMPSGNPLSDADIAKFECWIKDGALEN
ncbi:MAG: hypothetical protein M3Q58_16980 [Bacteroidota bacterium]|nr:hypothetical protein [Bacteroidota bacterium]